MKFYTINLGCKVNAYECESVASRFETEGFERTFEESEAEILLLFTCAVTNTAAQKTRQALHKARRNHPKGILIVAGCYSELEGDALSDADIIIGTENKSKIVDYVKAFIQSGQRVNLSGHLSKQPTFESLPMKHFENQTRAFLKIQDGCNQFCSYCVIPYARGRERSMAVDQVLQEAYELSRTHSEIVLTGIHTGRYGREFGSSLSSIMKQILAKCPDLKRLRISSIEVTEIDEDFMDLFIHEDRIAKHLHIPLQAGSDSILKAMNRPYDTATYYAKIKAIQDAVPGCSISTDLIVGFPGESQTDFEETLAFIQKCRFTFLHVFPFSVRKNTVAEKMTPQIDGVVKKQRAAECLQLSNQLYDTYKDSWIGSCVEVVAEPYRDGKMKGHASQYFTVTFEGAYQRGDVVQVRITKRVGNDLYGERLES